MDLQLKDRIILVAGGSRGIGLGIVECCLDEGAKVALVARGSEALEQARARLAQQYGADRLWTAVGDMRDASTIDSTIARVEDEFGPIWGAVANVGLYPSPFGIEMDDETWDGGISQNLSSSYRLARPMLKRFIARGEGSFLFISSIAGLAATGTELNYGVAKAAMNHLSKELARLAGPQGVRVNTIAPGNILFPGGGWEERSTGERAEAWARWIRREVPLRRYGAPHEIGVMAAMLLSPVASFVTGAVIPADGGQTK